jgi:hypothetical protein
VGYTDGKVECKLNSPYYHCISIPRPILPRLWSLIELCRIGTNINVLFSLVGGKHEPFLALRMVHLELTYASQDEI